MVRHAALSVGGLLLLACSASGPSAATVTADAPAATTTAPDGVAVAVSADDRKRVPQPATPATSAPAARAPEIISQATRQGRIDPECDLRVRYASGTVRNMTVALGSCEDLRLSFHAVAELSQRQELDNLEPFERADIERSTDGFVLYAESDFTASAYPLNDAGDAYEVVLAD